jgi:hypothetical protein
MCDLKIATMELFLVIMFVLSILFLLPKTYYVAGWPFAMG